jgi:hypothetical protein
MGKESTLDVLKGILIFFVNAKNIGSVQDIARVTGRDRTAIGKYLDFYADLCILKKYKIGNRHYYTINELYFKSFEISDILEEKNKKNVFEKKGR